MKKSYLYAIGAVIATLAIIGIYLVAKPKPAPVTKAAPRAVVEITSKGFVPATLSVKKGTTVVWTNKDTKEHRVASNPHPVHTDLKGLDSLSNIANGASYSFTYKDAGSFNYHDHLNPTSNGTIVVSE